MKYYLYLLAVVAGFVLGGCSEDVIVNGGDVPESDGAARLKVTFSNGAETRALGDPLASEMGEKTINRLSFYVYPAKDEDKAFVPFQRYVFDMTALPLTKDSVQIAYTTGTDAADGYTCNFILREGAGFECIVVAIANAPDNFDETNNLNTYAKLQQAYIDCATMPDTPDADLTASTRADKYGLVMYAEDTRMIKKSLTTDVAFKMERLAARIDISNAAYDEDVTKGFVLQSARVVNAKHTSYVIPALAAPWTHPGLTMNFEAVTSVLTPAAFQLASKTGQDSQGNTIDVTDPTIEAGKIEQRLWHALYTYENDDREASTATTIEIKGLFRGAPFSRILPFVNAKKEAVTIERNHRYLVRLNPAPGLTDLTYNIQVADWNAIDTINVKPTQKEKPEITYSPSFTPGADKTLELYKNVVTFTLDAVCSFDTQYQVVPELGDPADTDVSWLTVTPGEPEIVTRAATGVKRTYTVTTAAMATGTIRRAMLLIANGANFTARDTMHIKQTIYYPGTTLEPIAVGGIVWAPVNVGATEIATDLSGIAADATTWVGNEAERVLAQCGYYYQWGRNVPFKYGITDDIVEPTTYPTYVDACQNTGAYANVFIINPTTTPMVWFSDYKSPFSPELTDMKWPRKNQPCPSGWRIPTKDDYDRLIVKVNNTQTFDKGVLTVEGLAIPASGYRSSRLGVSDYMSNFVWTWTSTLTASDGSVLLEFRSSYLTASTTAGNPALGLTVRCVAE